MTSRSSLDTPASAICLVLGVLVIAASLPFAIQALPESAKGFVLIPHHPTLQGYREAFTTGPFDRYFMNSAIFAVTVTLGGLLRWVPPIQPCGCRVKAGTSRPRPPPRCT